MKPVEDIIVKIVIATLLLPCFAVFVLLGCADFPNFCMRFLIGI
jgi:hypothetical protein